MQEGTALMIAKSNKQFWRRSRIGGQWSAVTIIVLSLFCMGLSSTPNTVQADPFATPAIERTWARADFPVIAGAVKRSWLYGPEPFFTTFEPYSDSPNGQRLIQYFDKARMEVTHPERDANNQYYVTNGLLVKEMILGNLQLGDERFSIRYPAFSIPVAGDSDSIGNNEAPTYASFYNVASTQFNREASPRIGEKVDDVIGKDGQLSTSPSLGSLVRFNYYDPTTRHNVAQPFYDFLKRQGTVYDGKTFTNGAIMDWTYTVGYPIAEPYWVVTKIGGIRRDVLVQMFERRSLTYTPSNPVDFQVEMGNVGRHYFTWRYDTRYDLSVPPSSNGTISPSAGLPGAKFVMRSKFFKQDEIVSITVFTPDAKQINLSNVRPIAGDLTVTITSQPASPLGLYVVEMIGAETGNIAKFNFLLYRIPDINNAT